MFYYARDLEYLNVKSFDTRDVTDMYGMFQDCSELKYLDL
jgi:surface protein